MKDISGITIKKQEFKVMAFADDLMFFISQPHISIPILLKAFDLYGNLSFFKINFTKSEILNVTIPQRQALLLKQNFPFNWTSHSLKYLGVNLTQSSADLYEANFLPLLNTLAKDLKKWNSLMISWFGRIATIKMSILPRLLYLFQTVPIIPPMTFFRNLKAIITKFIWQDKQHRISLSTLSRPKTLGGVGLPNFTHYNKAAILNRILDWHRNSKNKDWVDLEQKLSGIDLQALPWMTKSERPLHLQQFKIISDTLTTIDSMKKTLPLVSIPGPLTPLRHSNNFATGSDLPPTLQTLRIRNCLTGSLCKEKISLDQNLFSRPLSNWQYFQLRNYLHNSKLSKFFTSPLTSFETSCLEPKPMKHGISFIYALLQKPTSNLSFPFKEQWQKELNETFQDSQWEKICNLSHVCSVSSKYQETAYKLLSRWYRTPKKLHDIYPEVSGKCWRGCGGEGSLLHIWWDCPLILSFWREIKDQISLIQKTNLSLSPSIFLLHNTTESTSAYKKSLLIHMLNAAKMLIPLHWRSSTVPTLKEWRLQVDKIAQLEELRAVASDSLDAFRKTWNCWLEKHISIP